MAKTAVDPTLRELVRAIEESGRTSVPVALTVRGTVLHGELVSQQRYFADLAAENPLVSALEPTAGLLGKDYRKETRDSAHRYLHLRGGRVHPHLDGVGALWRIRLASVDAWTLHDMAPQAEDRDRSAETSGAGRRPGPRADARERADAPAGADAPKGADEGHRDEGHRGESHRDDGDDARGPFARLLHTT